MRKTIYRLIAVFTLLAVCGSAYLGYATCTKSQPTADEEQAQVVELTTEEFKELVFDFTSESEWKYKGDKPCVIDFYATWCGPCKVLKPRIKALAEEYKGKIYVYAVDVDKEPMLARIMGVQAMPTIFAIPTKGIPTKSVGALSMKQLAEMTDKVLAESKAEQ